jgi:hypothetical protein
LSRPNFCAGKTVFPYWAIFSLFATGALVYRYDPRSVGGFSPTLIVAIIALILFVGLRYDVGGDWQNYVDIFNYSSRALGRAIWEGDPAYQFLNWASRSIGADVVLVNFVCAIVFVWGIARFSKNEPNPWLTFLVALPYLIIVVGMGYTRQGVAIGLLLAALASFAEGKLIRFLLIAVFAAMFHRTAIIVLPLVALAVVRHRTAIWGVLAGLVIVLFDFLLSEYVSRFSANYIENSMESQGTGIRVAMNVLPALIFLAFGARFSRNEQERKLWRNYSLAALAAVGGLVVLGSSTAVDRLALYLIPIQLVVLGRLPYVFPRNDRPNSQLALGVTLYSAAIQFVWLNYATHAHAWLPYRMLFLSA